MPQLTGWDISASQNNSFVRSDTAGKHEPTVATLKHRSCYSQAYSPRNNSVSLFTNKFLTPVGLLRLNYFKYLKMRVTVHSAKWLVLLFFHCNATVNRRSEKTVSNRDTTMTCVTKRVYLHRMTTVDFVPWSVIALGRDRLAVSMDRRNDYSDLKLSLCIGVWVLLDRLEKCETIL